MLESGLPSGKPHFVCDIILGGIPNDDRDEVCGFKAFKVYSRHHCVGDRTSYFQISTRTLTHGPWFRKNVCQNYL